MLTLPEKRLNANAEAVFATDRLPVPDSGKKPRTAPGNALAGPSVPEASPQSRFLVFAHAPDSAFPAQIPRLHSVRMPARLLHMPPQRLRSCAVSALHSAPAFSGPGSAFRCRFRIPTRLLHPGAHSLFRRRGHIPQHRSSAALRKTSRTPTLRPAQLRLFPDSRLLAPSPGF